MKCPFCSAVLRAREIDDGWCDTCGKKLPVRLTAGPLIPGGMPPSPKEPGLLLRLARLTERICVAGMLLCFGACCCIPTSLTALTDTVLDRHVGATVMRVTAWLLIPTFFGLMGLLFAAKGIQVLFAYAND
jgi:hypothetical protein